jgi:hypothetical protein
MGQHLTAESYRALNHARFVFLFTEFVKSDHQIHTKLFYEFTA